MSNNVSYDNVDDRKEIYNLLANYMDDRERENFLVWACQSVNTPLSKVLRPGKNSTFHPKEVYWQLMCLAFMHKLSLDTVTNRLIELAKSK